MNRQRILAIIVGALWLYSCAPQYENWQYVPNYRTEAWQQQQTNVQIQQQTIQQGLDAQMAMPNRFDAYLPTP